MKVVFICYNYYTLGKAVSLIENEYKTYRCSIIFKETVNPFPSNLYKLCDIAIVRESDIKTFSKKSVEGRGSTNILQRKIQITKQWIFQLLYCKKVYYEARRRIPKNEKSILIVFKDNEPAEDATINWIAKERSGQCRVILIEEGFSLYRIGRGRKEKNGIIKFIISRVLNMPITAMYLFYQGMHANIDEIKCSAPEHFKNLKPHARMEVVKERYIYTSEFSKHYCSLLLNGRMDLITKYDDCDFIFLTQALIENGIVEKNKYLRSLAEILQVLSRHGTVLIKAHPREKTDYSDFISDRVKICSSQLNILPFQALYAILGRPRIITFYSSGITIEGMTMPPMFTYKLLDNEKINTVMDDVLTTTSNVVVCESLDGLDEALRCR
jgi:hypothetical protein